MIYSIGIAITFFLSFILFTKKGKSHADKILAVWLFFIGLHLTLFYLILIEKHLALPYLLGLEIPMPLLHGPFLFFYTTSLTRPKSIGRKYLLHVIPIVIGFLAIIPFLTLPSSKKIAVYAQEGNEYSTLLGVLFILIVLSGTLYSVWSFYCLKQYHKKIVEVFSYIEKISLKWLYFLILGFSIIWIVVIFGNDKNIFITVILYVLFIGYYGIKQVGIFTNQFFDVSYNIVANEIKNSESETIQTEKVKYKKSELTIQQLKSIYENLTQIMQKEKLFQTPELTLSDIAKRLDVHPNTLSQVINRVEQKNFFDYINGLRVEEFKKSIANSENQQFTMLSVAYECGFNSKTSFNRNFKKTMGMSPSEYIGKTNP